MSSRIMPALFVLLTVALVAIVVAPLVHMPDSATLMLWGEIGIVGVLAISGLVYLHDHNRYKPRRFRSKIAIAQQRRPKGSSR